jgi:hypothetical protein
MKAASRKPPFNKVNRKDYTGITAFAQFQGRLLSISGIQHFQSIRNNHLQLSKESSLLK